MFRVVFPLAFFQMTLFAWHFARGLFVPAMESEFFGDWSFGVSGHTIAAHAALALVGIPMTLCLRLSERYGRMAATPYGPRSK